MATGVCGVTDLNVLHSQVAVNNWQYVTAYVVCAALVSFAVLYRMSPPSNERSLNLIQWTIQLVGVACVYLACPLQEVGVASVAVALILYNTCWSVVSGCGHWWVAY